MFQIDPASHVPIYLQIVHQVRAALEQGRVRPGNPLPSVRALAADLGISQTTVARAYRELVRTGTATVRRGQGTYLAGEKDVCPREARQRARTLVRELLERTARLGLSVEELRTILTQEAEPGGGSQPDARHK